MSDLIDKQAVIDLWDKYYPYISVKAAEFDCMLRALPSAQPEQCKDAVSKAKVLETYADLYDVFDDNKGIQNELHKVFDRINNLPPAQPEQSESEDITFWKKRAREYEEMVLKLTDEMARGIKIDSVLITEEGIVFKKEKPEQRWIPIKLRPMDAEERKEWSEKIGHDLDDEEAAMFDCPMPDDGQEVWVCSKCGNVWQDTCQIDEGIYLEENGDWLDIVAWMPFNRPEPWKEGEAE